MKITAFVIWSLRTSVGWQTIALSVGTHLLMGMGSLWYVQRLAALENSVGITTVTAGDAFLVAFAGPALNHTSILQLLFWFIPQLLFFYLYGNHASNEFFLRGHIVLPRTGSRSRWWWGKLITTMGLVSGYTAIYFAIGLGILAIGTVGMGAIPTGGLQTLPPSFSFPAIVGRAVILSGTTLIMLSFLQLLLSLMMKREWQSFVILNLVILGSWLLGSQHVALLPWLPGSQSMLLRHALFQPSLPKFTVSWSLQYNIIAAASLAYIGLWYVKRVDIVPKIA